jgi:hypothetical protein
MKNQKQTSANQVIATSEDNVLSTALKPYQTVEESTGEVVSKYKYLEGHPRQYRFDAKQGKFNINGQQEIGDTLTFQPVAWRIFSDDILNMGRKNWAEVFFVDDKDCLSAILFHGYSVDNIYRLIEPLFYEDLSLADVVITATAERKENTKITPKGVYYIASFSYQIAEKAQTEQLEAFAKDHPIYRRETLTDTCEIRVAGGFYNPFTSGEVPLLAEAEAG